jgi:hypothetical protein
MTVPLTCQRQLNIHKGTHPRTIYFIFVANSITCLVDLRGRRDCMVVGLTVQSVPITTDVVYEIESHSGEV